MYIPLYIAFYWGLLYILHYIFNLWLTAFMSIEPTSKLVSLSEKNVKWIWRQIFTNNEIQ